MDKTFYCTFGIDQKPYDIGYYVKVHAKSENQARRKMKERFNGKWCGTYDSAEAAGVNRFGLEHIPEPEIYCS